MSRDLLVRALVAGVGGPLASELLELPLVLARELLVMSRDLSVRPRPFSVLSGLIIDSITVGLTLLNDFSLVWAFVGVPLALSPPFFMGSSDMGTGCHVVRVSLPPLPLICTDLIHHCHDRRRIACVFQESASVIRIFDLSDVGPGL